MFIDNNNNFYGKIGGRAITSFMKMNYELDTVEERIAHVNKVFGMYKVNDVEFYDEYWDEVYNQERPHSKIDIVLSNTKSTYSTSNIATSLEKVADYILKVDDYKDEDERNYIIYNSEELFNRACQEYNVTSNIARVNGGLDMMGQKTVDGDRKDKDKIDHNAFPFFQLPKNYNIVKDLKIEKKDLKRFPELKCYNDFYEYLKEENKKLWSKGKLTKDEFMRRYLIKKVMAELKKDMIVCKRELERPIIWKAPLSPKGCPSWDKLDMFDRTHVKELLRLKKGNDLQDDITCIVQDLNNIISKIELTERQRLILEMWSDGNDIKTIAKLTKIANQNVSKNLNAIVDKIIAQYEEDYTNWYYLNICKGQYKRCSKCGKVKLISEFDKKSDNKDGYKNNCKKCNKK